MTPYLKRKPPPQMLNAPMVYENVNHRGTKIIHATKFIRQRNDPAIRINVMAEKTNWKYTIDACGKAWVTAAVGRLESSSSNPMSTAMDG